MRTKIILRRRTYFFEALESRLALTWAGVPPIAISPPTAAASVALNSQSSASGTASIANTEVDYYSFVATTSGTYTISATTPTSSVDTVLGVFSASGQRLAYNDDIVFAQNTDSRLSINLVAGTRYYVGITNYSSSSRGAYTWTIVGPTVQTTTDDAYENNDTQATAVDLGTLSSAKTISSLVMADTQDWYKFTTTGAGTSTNTVSISFQNSQGNLQLGLYDAAGTPLASSQGTGNSESVSLNGLAAGTYYVKVFGNNGALNPNYSLTINPPAATTTTPTSSGFQITLVMSGLTASQQAIFQAAAARWSQVIVGDLPNAVYRGQTVDDLLINASSVPIDGVGRILGQSGPDAFRAVSDLPYHGVMQFDTADLASMQQSGLLYSVVLHEIGHILGIGTIWEDLGLLSGAGTSNPIFTGAQATAAYNQIFGTNALGVPVEATGGSGTADSHWRESILTNELMTGWAGPGTNLPLSTITIGSLADLGYTVNYAAADSFVPSSSVRAAISSRTVASASASLRASSEIASNVSTTIDTAAVMGSVAARTSGNNRATETAASMNAALVDAAVADNRSEFEHDRFTFTGDRGAEDWLLDSSLSASDALTAALTAEYSDAI